MPVRIIGEDDARPTEEPRRPRLWILYLAIAAVLTGALIFTAVTTPRPVTPGPSAPLPSAPAQTGATLDEVPPQFATNTGQVKGVPGLWRGTATVTSGNSGQLYQARIGWPHTLDGAIGAAFSQYASYWSVENFLPETAPKLDARLISKAAFDKLKGTPEQWEQFRIKQHVNSTGQPVDESGKVVPEEILYLAGFPRFSAYMVESVADDLSTATIRIWMPTVIGTGTVDDLSQVRVLQVMSTWTMVWEDGDWRQSGWTSHKSVPQASSEQTNASYGRIRELLGPGWLVPADSTDQPYEGAVLAQ